MSDYNLTRSVAGEVVTRFASMLEDLEDDYEEEIVVVSLMRQYRWATEEADEDLLWAIDRILQEFLTPDQYSWWEKEKRKAALDELAKADQEDGLI